MAIDNKYSWNYTLKFSWGHIVAFIALIFMSYVMFMGAFYGNGGKFLRAGIYVAIIDIALLGCFIGVQFLKASRRHFKRAMRFERLLLVLCPVVFIVAMIPYNHFWNVFDNREQLTTQFNEAVIDAQQIFTNYEQYANTRIENYDKTLDKIIKSRKQSGNRVTRANKDVYLRALRLQLISQNTDSIKNMAMQWTEKSREGSTVWNAFLMGNITQISDAVKDWQERLEQQSLPQMSNEGFNGATVLSFAECDTTYRTTVNKLAELSNIYTERRGLNFTTVWTGIILLLMLSMPYFLQLRNTRASGLYHILPKNRKTEHPSVPDNDNDIYTGPF